MKSPTAQERAIRLDLLSILKPRPMTMQTLKVAMKLPEGTLLYHLQELRKQGILCRPHTNHGSVWAYRTTPPAAPTPKPLPRHDQESISIAPKPVSKGSWWLAGAQSDSARDVFVQAAADRDQDRGWAKAPRRFGQGKTSGVDRPEVAPGEDLVSEGDSEAL